MPAVRDYAFSLHSTNTLRSLEVPMPAYNTGDLLIAMMSADTGTTQVWKGGNSVASVQYDDSGAFTDYTTASNNATTADVFFVPAAPTVNDAWYVGSSTPFTDVFIQFSTQGAGTWTITWEYWNGAWTGLSGVTDNTTGFKAATTFPVNATWTMPTDWATTTVNGVGSTYYVRGRVSAFTSITTRPVGTRVWVCDDTPNGWKQFDSTSNTANLGWLYKTASATEVDTTFFYTIAETVNGMIISIRDVDVGADTGSGAQTISVNATNKTFTRSAGSFVTDGFKAGMVVTTSGFTNGGNNGRKEIATVTATVLTMTVSTGLVNETGNANERVVWSPFDGSAGIAKSTTSAAKANMPSITTVKNNCLLLYGMAHSAVSVPSIIEGPVTQLVGKDGSAHSDACAWSIQGVAGASSSSVGQSNLSAAAAQLAVVAVAPRGENTSADIVVPGYCAADSSVYVTPYTAAAFNGDSAVATTFTTAFTGTIDGKTLANATTAAALADAGVNSFHALVNTTPAGTTANTYYGHRTTIVARTTLASKNILFHVQPTTPVAIQTTDSVTLSGSRGVIICIGTTAGNFKAYHVSGGFNSWGVARNSPVVINTDYSGAGLLQTTGSFNAASITEIGLAISNKTTAAAWSVGSIWALDTCTIAGGSTAEPLDMEGIIRAYADGHERRSAIRQGKSQGLFLGPIQIGNGGTNPVTLGLDATAMEFPRQYNQDLREVYYNSVDNFAGLIYYPGASDVITHTNSVISSPSRYKWGLHSSASASATYDFDGLNVIGAGTITLNKAITITGLTINDYSTLDLSGATFTDGIIKAMPATNDSITTSSTTVISNSTITTTTVTAGNRWASVAIGDLDIFANNTFIGSSTSGHAIRISSTGTATFVGNTFTSYGPVTRSFNTGTGVDSGTDIVTTDSAHGYTDGDPVYYQDQGGSQNMGLTDGTLYYVNAQTSTTLSFHTSSANAIADTSRVNLTSTGTETHYIYSAAAAIYNNSGGAVTINITGGGGTPSIRNSDGSSTTVNKAVTVKITAKDANTLVGITDARVLMEASSVATGTHTGSNNASTLTDSNQSFTVDELIGYRIYNTTDGSDGLITDNDATTVTATLAGGTQNDWDTSDSYIIVALPALNPVSITSSTTTATVTHRNHGLATSASVVIRGATEDAFNGVFTITVTSANTYTYTFAGNSNSPATGSPTSTAVILNGITGDGSPDPVGELQTTTFNYTINQPVTGKVRRAALGTKYKTGAITGTITSTGLDTTVLLIADE